MSDDSSSISVPVSDDACNVVTANDVTDNDVTANDVTYAIVSTPAKSADNSPEIQNSDEKLGAKTELKN
jgi:hypothetical protein